MPAPFDLSGESSRTFVTFAVGAVVALSALAFTYFATRPEDSSSAGRNSKKTSAKSSSKSSTKSTSSSNISKPSSVSDTVIDTSVEADGSNADLRGYKSLNDGRKTSYFHRELSDDEKRLLGDCTPRQIDPNATSDQSFSPRMIQRTDSGSSTSSVWNSAGTFEEKNINEWSQLTLKALLKDMVVVISEKYEDFDSVKVVVTSVSQVSGDSVIINSRGKKKYIYDLTADLSWKLTANAGGSKGAITIEGTASVHDITADLSQESNFALTSRNDPTAQNLYNVFIRGSKPKYGANLKNAIASNCAAFYDSLKQKY